MDAFHAFILGSNFVVFALFFLIVSNISKSKRNFSYSAYTFVAPVALGLMNVVAYYVATILQLSVETKYLAMSIIAPACVLTFAWSTKMYNFTPHEWREYVVILFALYYLVCNSILFDLETALG